MGAKWVDVTIFSGHVQAFPELGSDSSMLG
jgi:hypothetical protein